ncbi:MAG: alkaline phosphatase family protein, partial [Nanoarchaeota archaeon]
LFFFGPELTQYITANVPSGWAVKPIYYSPLLEAKMSSWGSTMFALIYDSTDDNITNYDKILFSTDKKSGTNILNQGEWSQWLPITLKWQDIEIESYVMVNVIKLDDDGFFRIRLFYDNMNKYNVEPSSVATEFNKEIGPMVDFVDNFPPQLIYYNEDKMTFLQEMNMSFDWHTKSISFMINQYNPDIIIHDIYSPNQMLTSRWWMGNIDPTSRKYNSTTEAERKQSWQEVKSMYMQLDGMIGEILDNVDENTIVVLSSDHGVVPLDKWVHLNNLFSQKGWLKFTINNQTGEPIIDWKNSKVIYLKMDNVYIDPEGLDGNWTRASGEEYEKLREEVTAALLELNDTETGERPVDAAVKWEDVEEYLDLPADRVGDLVIANKAGYGWNEEMSASLNIFSTPLIGGYKQAVFANETKSMWTPFIIMGPGVKKGFRIKEPITHIDQYPTIMKLLGFKSPEFVDGKELDIYS